MTPDEFLSLADNPDLIEGIYNYCDRWCERCMMTQHCLLFASTPADADIPKGSVEDRKHAMVRQIEASFSLTIELLNKITAEKGIDLPDPDAIESSTKDFEQQQKDVQHSALTRLSKQYLDGSKKWFDNCDAVLLAKDKELEQMGRMNLSGRDSQRETEDLKNAMDVIHWYQFQITVKLVRAQNSRMRQIDWDDTEDEQFPKDSDGSAKVALIGIDRSIGAWGILFQSLPDQEELILNLLTILERLRRMVEKEFPNARGFKRPGFED